LNDGPPIIEPRVIIFFWLTKHKASQRLEFYKRGVQANVQEQAVTWFGWLLDACFSGKY